MFQLVESQQPHFTDEENKAQEWGTTPPPKVTRQVVAESGLQPWQMLEPGLFGSTD